MNSGPGRIWWRGEHARLKKRWRCSPTCISKSILDRHHQTKLKLKFYLCQSNSCQKIFQNIVTWGVELRSRNTIFACFPIESLFSGVHPSNTHTESSKYHCSYGFLSWNERGISSNSWISPSEIYIWPIWNWKRNFYCIFKQEKKLADKFPLFPPILYHALV